MNARKKKTGTQVGESGFTLIEFMVAIVILSIGLLGVAKMQVGAIDGNTLSSNTTIAMTLAEDKMEELFNLDPFDDDDGNVDPQLQDTAAGNNGLNVGNYDDDDLDSLTIVDNEELNLDRTGVINGAAGGASFRRVWNVVRDNPIDGAMTICVMVTWKNDTQRVRLCSTKIQ